MVLVEEVKAGGTPRPECPRDDQVKRSLADMANPAGVTVYEGPGGPDGTLKEVLEPLEHSVLDNADSPDWHAFAQEVLEPLEHSAACVCPGSSGTVRAFGYGQ